MRGLLQFTARAAGVLGILLCLAAGIGRLAGAFWIAGFTAATVFGAGAALVLVGCFCYLAILVENPWPHQ